MAVSSTRASSSGTGQNEVLSETNSSGANYKLVYGRTDLHGQPVIEQYKTASSTAFIENDPGTGMPIMLRSTNGVECLYVNDALGNPVALITDFAVATYTLAYDPYGAATLTSGGTGSGYSQNPFLFKGGIQDRASGLVKFGIRWYNPTTGTWTQQDTLDTPLSLANANRYAYAGDDPTNGYDPGGTTTCAERVQAGAATAAAGGIVFLIGTGVDVTIIGIPFGVLVQGVGIVVAGLGLLNILFGLVCEAVGG